MGYTTDFDGEVEISPPLNAAEIEYINRFGSTRRMKRTKGPYYANPGSDGFGQDQEADILDYNSPPTCQPGLWCQWEASADGRFIYWNGAEKFYNATAWMAYLIEHFLKPGARAKSSGDPQFAAFTFDHIVNGTIEAQGEDAEDMWRLVVTDNKVETKHATIVWS